MSKNWHSSKLNEDTMAKNQKSDEEPTPLLDHAASRLVKKTRQKGLQINNGPITYHFWRSYIDASVELSNLRLFEY